MKAIYRYGYNEYGRLDIFPDGEFVRYSDYASLKKEHDILKNTVSELEFINSCLDYDNELLYKKLGITRENLVMGERLRND